MTRTPSPLETFRPSGAHAEDFAELRRLIGEFYDTHSGLSSAGMTEGQYERLIFPNDPPGWRHRAADDMWSCALRFEAAMRLLRVEHPLLAAPYSARVGRAVEDCAAVARTFVALVEGADLMTYEPQAGDAFCSGWGNSVHVSCVVRSYTEEGGDLVLECSDGGQGRRGAMLIDRNVYVWRPGRVASIEVPHTLDAPGPLRPLVWVVDVEALILNAGVLRDV